MIRTKSIGTLASIDFSRSLHMQRVDVHTSFWYWLPVFQDLDAAQKVAALDFPEMVPEGPEHTDCRI